ncbi:MAG: imidazoleglycerol-phosphate dehydratase HisB [Candidatus Woesearchaeota archaeon]
MRSAKIDRESLETNIKVDIMLEGEATGVCETTIPFLDHMLTGFTKHGGFTLHIKAMGDTYIDQHHLLEDLGMVLGKSFKKALGDKKGINRAGFFAFPMDDALSVVSVDFSGRPYLVYKASFKRQFAGELDTDCLREFFSGFSMGAGCNIAIYVPYGHNDHHKIESIFKSFAKALKMAISIDQRLKEYIPSSKGLLDDHE